MWHPKNKSSFRFCVFTFRWFCFQCFQSDRLIFGVSSMNRMNSWIQNNFLIAVFGIFYDDEIMHKPNSFSMHLCVVFCSHNSVSPTILQITWTWKSGFKLETNFFLCLVVVSYSYLHSPCFYCWDEKRCVRSEKQKKL